MKVKLIKYLFLGYLLAGVIFNGVIWYKIASFTPKVIELNNNRQPTWLENHNDLSYPTLEDYNYYCDPQPYDDPNGVLPTVWYCYNDPNSPLSE